MENYKIVKFLNKGSYGKVFLVEKIPCNTKYALKSIEIVNIDRYTSLSILNEIKILLTNDNDYLLKCYDIFINNKNELCLITEYIKDGDLDNYIKNKRSLNKEDIVPIFLKICVGLNSLHHNLIVHRDIKPANILFSENGDLKICDFGVSKYLTFCKITKTLIGTPYFMSPEQFLNNYYDYKIDVWALGCVLYQLIYNKFPFNGKNVNELKNNIINNDPLKNIINTNICDEHFKKILIHLFQKNRYSRLNLDTFLNDESNKKLLDFYKINYKKTTFKNYKIKVVPRSINDWKNLLTNIKKDFNLPKNIIVNNSKGLKRSEAQPNLKVYNDLKTYNQLKNYNVIKNSKIDNFNIIKQYNEKKSINEEKNNVISKSPYEVKNKINSNPPYQAIDYNKLDYSKLDYSKLDYNKLDYNKLEYSKLDYSKLDYSKLDYSKLDYNKLEYSKLDYSKLEYSKLDYSKLEYSKLEYSKLDYNLNVNNFFPKLENKNKYDNIKWISNLRKY